uniref:Si:dkey-83f18.14 n=1 Tax=Sander lucioperca TaxID=283035 RepID=A0A8C9X636_SANLU
LREDLYSYTLPSHSDTLFTRLNSLQEEDLLLDCIFPLQGKSFQAHRLVLAAASQHPDVFFGSKLKCGLGVEDIAHCLTPVGLSAVLDFAYCGNVAVDFSKKGIWELTDALCQFQLQGALSLCIDFLRDRMDESTCLDVLVLAETYALVQLGQAAEEYILAHFQCISAGEKFKDVPCSFLEKMLEKDSLYVESEIVVFRAVVDWVEDSPKERLPVLPGLLHRIRLPLLSYSDLKNKPFQERLGFRNSSSPQLIKASPRCFPSAANYETEPSPYDPLVCSYTHSANTEKQYVYIQYIYPKTCLQARLCNTVLMF